MLQQRYVLLTILVTAGVFVGLLIFLELGRRLGVRQQTRRGEASRIGVGVVDGTVFALVSLLIGFSFSGAAGRFDARRQHLAEEVNAIGTAYMRVDALPAVAQEEVRAGFRHYFDLVLASYGDSADVWDPRLEPEAVGRARRDLWRTAVRASLTPEGEKARMLLLPAMNEMFDQVEMERLARRIHPPLIVFAALGLVLGAGAIFAGYAMASGPNRNWIHVVGVAAAVALAAFVILELEYPRLGFVRMDSMDSALLETRAGMGETPVPGP